MLRLFGGTGERVFAAYAECRPLAPGHEERVPLYQLYPLLVHLNRFGVSHRADLERVLALSA
jgi:fructosamine-3-kinase